MQIHQLSVTYQAEQDRLLVRINSRAGEEMRLWLTRRLMVGLWPVLGKLHTEQLLAADGATPPPDRADEDLRRMLADFRKEELLQKADFDTPYQDKENLPLGADPLLATHVDATPLPGGRLRLAFSEKTGPAGAKARGFQVELDTRLMQGFVHLLEQALARAQWREPFVSAAPLAEAGAETPADRPRYLN